MINRVLKNVKREDLIFEKLYQVKAIYDKPKGKWSSVTKDNIFLDSKDFFKIYSDKVYDRIMNVMGREYYSLYTSDGGISALNYQIVGTILGQINQ